MNQQSRGYQIQQITNEIVQDIWANSSVMARLRIVKHMSDPQANIIWPVMMHHMPKYLLSNSGQPTKAETAIFMTLRAFADYQRGEHDHCLNIEKDTRSWQEKAESQTHPKPVPNTDTKHIYGLPVMAAAAKIVNDNPDLQKAFDRRMDDLLGSHETTSIINQTLRLVAIIKSKTDTQPIDFGDLARDLYDLQVHTGNYDGMRRVLLRWGQEYYANQTNIPTNTTNTNID